MMGLGMVELTRRSRLPSQCGMLSAKRATSASECRASAYIVWSQFKAASIIPLGTMCHRQGGGASWLRMIRKMLAALSQRG
jgi:hypothetical protein